MLVAALEATKL